MYMYVYDNIKIQICINSRWSLYDLPIFTYQLKRYIIGSWVDYYYLSSADSKCKIHLWSKHDYKYQKIQETLVFFVPVQNTRDIEPVKAEFWDSNVII